MTPQQGGAAALLQRAMGVLALWRRRIRTRAELRKLGALDDHVLQDIGMTRSQLISEASKPFWREAGEVDSGSPTKDMRQCRNP
jgi:uncharacterized protein YjiS (DUF1127 family)